jgi:SM-20-related protein
MMPFVDQTIIDFFALKNAQVRAEPFPFCVVPEFLKEETADQISKDFPKIDFPGSVPLPGLEFGPMFGKLIRELEGDPLRQIIERKFELSLKNRPTLITVRGRTRAKDGRIHSDTKSKLLTLLLYFNREWENEGGRLRILRNPENLEDYAEEITPIFGTCLIFKVTENCWHGHKPFEGERRAIQLNYLSDEAALKQHLSKHQLSARLKGWKRWFSARDEY